MAIDRLIRNFESFRKTYYDDRPGFFRELVEKGQRPEVMVIACSDSRINASILGKAKPGELFIVRNVANLVPPYEPDGKRHGTSAAVEFAVRDLKVRHIVLLGHSHCGGIKFLCEGEQGGEKREFIEGWMSIVERARDDSLEGEMQLRHVEREAVKVSLENLMTFPWVASRVEAGDLELHGWLFDLEAGRLLALTPDDRWIDAK
jgi:carbonic anhydrase